MSEENKTTADLDDGLITLSSTAAAPPPPTLHGGFGSAAPVETGSGFGVRPAAASGGYLSNQRSSFGESRPFSFSQIPVQRRCCSGFDHPFSRSRTEPPSKDDPLSIFFENHQISLRGDDFPWSWDSRIKRNSVDVPNTLYFNTRIKNLNYKDMWSRKLTFRDNWCSKQMSQQPKELAEAGFYYIGPADHVKCAFCGLIIRDWGTGEVPMFSHIAWSRIEGKICPWAEANFGALFNASFCKK